MAGRQRSLRYALSGLSAVAIAGASLVAGGARAAYAADDSPQYYLALGDSLSQGVQPNASPPLFETNHGYVDDLYAVERAQHPGLQLQKLGCPGETTTSMINGGICPYALGSQLKDAVAFLATHHVAFMTIDIGANNIDSCVTSTGDINATCVGAGFTAAYADLPVILYTLRSVAPTVPIYAMNYYDPFLATWLAGNQALARESVCITTGLGYGTDCVGLPPTGFDGGLDAMYGAFGVPVADVATAFQTNNFTQVPFVKLPVNVALVCSWTWACSSKPDFHANDIGYAVIAATFARTIEESR